MQDAPELGYGTLSLRARQLLDQPPSAEYLREHFARSAAPYDAVTNPGGYIGLCVAENRLVWDLLATRLTGPRALPHQAVCYDSMIGSLGFRRQLARFVGERVLGRQVAAEQVAVLAGAGTVLEMLFHALADPGEGILVPTPSYAGFWPDLETRDGLVIVPAHCASADGFRLTTELLDLTLARASRPVRALLFTSPNNPLGTVYAAEDLDRILEWTAANHLHLVLDEVYALSVFGGRRFVSGASRLDSLGERVHVVWAFSKDFGVSGLRCGVLVSENQAALRAVDALAYWACCSGDTQHVLGAMIEDDAWTEGFIASMRARLAEAYRRVTSELDAAGIPYLPAEAGFFFLCDLRRFLPEPSWEGERALWRRVLEQANVNLTPGAACRVAEPGFARLCFASVPTDAAVAAVQRLRTVLAAR